MFAVVAMLMFALPAYSAPHEDTHHDDIGHDDTPNWDVIAGTLDYIHKADEGPSNTYGGSDPTWYRLRDGSGTDGGLAIKDPDALDPHDKDTVNESLTRYELGLEMSRENESGAAGHIGVVFGANETGAHYAVTFDEDTLALRAPDAVNGSDEIDAVPYAGSPAFTALAGVDDVHRYTVKVDGRELRIEVDGFQIHNWTLDELDPALPDPVGSFGVRVADQTTAFVQRLHYLPLDEAAPTVDVLRPTPGLLYLLDDDSAALPWVVDPTVPGVVGDLTVQLAVADDVLGIASLHVLVDGERSKEHSAIHVEDGTYEFTLETHDMSIGRHTVEIVVRDYAGNGNAHAPASFAFDVVPTAAPTGLVSGTLGSL